MTPCWREVPHATPKEHAEIQARFRAMVRDRWAHPKPVQS